MIVHNYTLGLRPAVVDPIAETLRKDWQARAEKFVSFSNGRKNLQTSAKAKPAGSTRATGLTLTGRVQDAGARHG